MSLLPYFLEKLQSLQDGDATLLDKSLIVYGSPMGDGNVHNHKRCPLVLLGGANGQLAGNVHHRAEAGTPMANVMLTAMHKIGLTDIAQFGDSTGEFSSVAAGLQTGRRSANASRIRVRRCGVRRASESSVGRCPKSNATCGDCQ